MSLMDNNANVSVLSNYIYKKTRSSPQRVELEFVRYIAAGESHSLAITDSITDGKPTSNLYSWGWGAYG